VIHVLLLAGTAEARRLSFLLADEVRLTTSLAGVTRRPAAYAGQVRTGGFGGADGLAAFLRMERVDALIDATHPFAERMHHNASLAAGRAAVPLLRLERPAWPVAPSWIETPDLDTAIAALPPGAVAFLATGRSSAGGLPIRRDLRLVLRAIEPPEGLPAAADVILAPPSEDPDQEATLFARQGITHLVCRNSGGAGRAKLDAAARLGLQVLMIPRPAPIAGTRTVSELHAAHAWVRALPSMP